MSKIRKARKLRSPNVPLDYEPVVVAPVAAAQTEARVSETTVGQFDYSHTVSDLRRIGLLAGTFIVVLIALTFVIR
ncbi:MAG: hypothetical protein JNL73_00275 [Anaerolineales bacterium]|nr:hypothetical protein [Anaerolineales bacterium]